MKEPNPRRSNVLRTIFISITLLLNGLSAAGLGYIISTLAFVGIRSGFGGLKYILS